MPDSKQLSQKGQVLTKADIHAISQEMYQTRQPLRNWIMVNLTYYHALRSSELVALKTQDIDLDTGHIYIRRVKGSEHTEHIIPKGILKAIRKYLVERRTRSVWLFPGESGNHLAPLSFNRLLGRTERPTNPQALRHARGHHLAQAGQDIHQIQAWFGHKQIQNTRVYFSDLDLYNEKQPETGQIDQIHPETPNNHPKNTPFFQKWLANGKYKKLSEIKSNKSLDREKSG